MWTNVCCLRFLEDLLLELFEKVTIYGFISKVPKQTRNNIKEIGVRKPDKRPTFS